MLIKAKEESSFTASIEMTPLIDMVFLLLIFFLVATTFHQAEREMQIALPVASASGPISAMLREIVVNVDLGGTIFIGGRETSPEDLRSMVTEAVKVNPEQKVSVRGDRGTAWSNIVTVLDICKSSGVQEPYIDTMLEK